MVDQPAPPTINGVPQCAGPGHEFHVEPSKIHINFVKPEDLQIKRHDCPTCKKSRFMVLYFEEWYGASLTCLKCGESWCGGEMRPRPFQRGWRKEAVRHIKEWYRGMKKAQARIAREKT